jgi:hypothetical protein
VPIIQTTNPKAVFISLLRAPCHTGGFNRDDRGKLPLGDNHAARVLTQMPREIEHPYREFKVLRNAGMMKIEPGILKLLFHGVGRTLPLPGADELRELFGGLNIEAERLACLAGCGLATVGDDVGAHRGTKLPVAGESEFGDESELPFDLPFGLLPQLRARLTAIPIGNTLPSCALRDRSPSSRLRGSGRAGTGSPYPS